MTSFASVAVVLNRKLCKGQLQTFDGLSDKEINSLQMLKAKSVDPFLLSLPHSQSAMQEKRTVALSKLDVSYCNGTMTGPTNQ